LQVHTVVGTVGGAVVGTVGGTVGGCWWQVAAKTKWNYIGRSAVAERRKLGVKYQNHKLIQHKNRKS